MWAQRLCGLLSADGPGLMSRFDKPPRGTIDFETRSTVDLRKHGTWRYATAPTTAPLVMAFRLPHWTTGQTEIWTPEYPDLGIYKQGGNFDALFELFEWIQSGKLVEAHNAWFERNIWRHIMVPRFGWPEMPARSWRCSAAQAAAVSLPRGLDDALAAMRLALRKDATGAKVMMKMTKPRKARKAERESWLEQHGNKPMGVLFHEDRHLLQQLFDYVRQDVLAEEGLSYVLPDLSDDELEMYWLDQEMNDRGFQLDMEAVDAALYMIQEESLLLNAELGVVTDGQVERATQRKQLQIWLEMEGVVIENTQAATLDLLLESWPATGSDNAKRAVEILRLLGKSSTAKYEAMRNHADLNDHRVRGGLLYHGAGTGRWSGSGVMPHNFPKGTLKEKDVNGLWETLKTLDRPTVIAKYGDVMAALSHGLRSAIVAGPGMELFCADYASIEARVLLWLAGDDTHLDIFRNGEDIYVSMATDIYKRPITKADALERQVGKFSILGLGFGMGWQKFFDTLAKAGIHVSEDFTQTVVSTYREKFWRTKELWRDTEAAAVKCAITKRPVDQGPFRWVYHDPFLFMELPSGRRLAYPFPRVSAQETPWGEKRDTLTFMGVNPKTRQWQPQKSYGGLLVENGTQAVARDVLAGALKRLEDGGVYRPVLSVHDEVISEAAVGTGNVKEYEDLLCVLPDWADGLPVKAEGWSGLRYKKG